MFYSLLSLIQQNFFFDHLLNLKQCQLFNHVPSMIYIYIYDTYMTSMTLMTLMTLI